MSHGSYDLNLGSEILILGKNIRSRSWPNIGDSYGMYLAKVSIKYSYAQIFCTGLKNAITRTF